jgi:DegV family protein with EDD domain
MLKIVVDSTCNLPPDFLRRHDIRVAPISIQFGEETFEEGIDIDRALFYEKIEAMGIIPTTAQPTPAWFAKFYQELHGQGHSILAITITSKHSGTYDSAMLAKSMVPEADVAVFDSLSISFGTGFLIHEALSMIEEGKDRDAILDRLKAIREGTSLFLTPATLKYLQMSGRVGRLQSALGSLLDLKPIIAIEDGELAAKENVRTRSKAVERILELTEANIGTTKPANIAVVHANAPEEGETLLDEAQARFSVNDHLYGDLVPSLAVHGGPGVLGLFGYTV